MKHDSVKVDASKTVDVKGKISDDGRMFVSDKDSKTGLSATPTQEKATRDIT